MTKGYDYITKRTGDITEHCYTVHHCHYTTNVHSFSFQSARKMIITKLSVFAAGSSLTYELTGKGRP